MKSIKKRIIIYLIAILLCVSVSYSWILDSMHEPPASDLVLDMQGREYGKIMSVFADGGYSIEILKYIDANTVVTVDATHPLLASAMVPGESLRFKIRLRNSNSSTGEVKLFLSGLTCTYTGTGTCNNPSSILDNIYLSVVPGEGYYNTDNLNLSMPSMIYSKLSDLRTTVGDSTVVLYTDIQVPYTPTANDYVELECRFWFDVNATNLEDITLHIGKFVLSL